MTTMVTATTTIIPMIMIITATITTVIATTTTVNWLALGFCAGVIWLIVVFAIAHLASGTRKRTANGATMPTSQPTANALSLIGGSSVDDQQEPADLAAELDEMIKSADRRIRFLKSVVRGREPLKTEIAPNSNSDQNPPPDSDRLAA